MEIGHIIPHIEALLFASDKPLTPIDVTELINNAFGFMEDKITMEQIQTAIEGIVEKYNSEFYPFELRESGGGWQFLTKKDYHKTIAQLNGDKFLKRLSTAALETLAIIAYKQPITKSDIEAIRGVSCDYSIQKLLEKELIVITGRNEELPGKPLVYNTSRTFMDYFGINSPADLPKLKEIFNDAIVDPTIMNSESPETGPEDVPAEPVNAESEEEQDSAGPLVVTENGELTEQPDEQSGQDEQDDLEELNGPGEQDEPAGQDQPEEENEPDESEEQDQPDEPGEFRDLNDTIDDEEQAP